MDALETVQVIPPHSLPEDALLTREAACAHWMLCCVHWTLHVHSEHCACTLDSVLCTVDTACAHWTLHVHTAFCVLHTGH